MNNNSKKKKQSSTTHVKCPFSFKKYNKYTGGIDLADQQRTYYRISHKSVSGGINNFFSV